MKQIMYLKGKSSLWTFFNYTRFAEDIKHIFLPAELAGEWQQMPVQVEDSLENDRIFSKFNADSNPLSSSENQAWIHNSAVRHTSMSVGDAIKTSEGKWFVCLNIGWAEIAWIDARHGHLVSLDESDSFSPLVCVICGDSFRGVRGYNEACTKCTPVYNERNAQKGDCNE